MVPKSPIHLFLSPLLDSCSIFSNEDFSFFRDEGGLSIGVDVNQLEQVLKSSPDSLAIVFWLPPDWTFAISSRSNPTAQDGLLEFEKLWINGVRAQLRLKKLFPDKVAIIDARELAANVDAGRSRIVQFTGLADLEKATLPLKLEPDWVILPLVASAMQDSQPLCAEMLAASESLNPDWKPHVPEISETLRAYTAFLAQAESTRVDLENRLAAIAVEHDSELNTLKQQSQNNVEILFEELQNAFKESEDFCEELEKKSSELDSTQQELHEIHQANHRHFLLSEKLRQELDTTQQELHEIHQANHHRFLLVNALQKQCADLAAERDSILGSTCWRITSPIRWLRRLLGLGRFNSSEPLDQQIIKHSALYIRRRPALKAFVLKVLLRNPGLHAKVVPVLGEIKRQESAILHQQNPANAPELTNHAKRILQRLESEMQSKPSQVNS